MRDKLTDAIRIGKVSSINSDKGTAKVTFTDRDDIVTRELPILFTKTSKDYYYCMPDIGERVRCFFDPEAPSKGFILGSFPSDTREPPIKDENKTYVLFKDETLVEYDREIHKLTIKIPAHGEKSIDIFSESDINVETNGNINVKVAKDISIGSAQNISIKANANLDITINGNTTINTEGTTDITSGEVINITAPVVNING